MDHKKPIKVFPITSRPRDGQRPPEEPVEDEEEDLRDILLRKEQAPPEVIDDRQLQLQRLPVAAIVTSPFQTRDVGNRDDLEELKNSIQSRGIIQPIVVRQLHSGSVDEPQYELVAGERRLRAAKLAGLSTVPAIVQSLDDQGSVELMIIENAQRENLNPVEEAQAYLILADRFHLSHAEIARIVGKNRATVSNSLRLLQLEPEVIELLRNGELTAGHGRALLMIDGAEWQLKLARLAVKKALSVRALEGLVSRFDEAETVEDEPSEADVREEQSRQRTAAKIGDYLGIEKVALRSDTQGRRRLTLSFDTEAAWRRFMSKIRD